MTRTPAHLVFARYVLLLCLGACAVVAVVAGCQAPSPRPESPPLPASAPGVQAPSRPSTRPAIRYVRAKEAADLIAASRGKSVLAILDVRTQKEYDAGHVAGCLLLQPNLDDAALQAAVKNLPRDRTCLLYCVVGVRASRMARRLAEMGYIDLIVLEGGFPDLKAQGVSVEGPAASMPAS